MQKWEIKESKIKLLRKYDSIKGDWWDDRGVYSNKLYFLTQRELNQCVDCLLRWRDVFCCRFLDEMHRSETKPFFYFPIDSEFKIMEKLWNVKADMHQVHILFKLGMKYDETT